jgi:type III secretion protein C
MKEFQKRLWFEVALCASFLNLIHSSVAYSLDRQENLNFIADASSTNPDISQNTFTINFNNVSIIEFIRFASKITNLNFVFEEGDLQFSVTVVSEEPVSAKNVMSALAQVLRVHDMTLLEQENNVLIVKSADVNQIPTIISGDLPESQAGNAALVTQVFRIKNANLNSLAGIIRPMTSRGSLIEVSNETRQLIVTDITTNVEKIAALLASLDAPHTPLDIETYVVKNIGPQDLISLTQQILTPFAEGNPLIFVPQLDTNSIFIVSTPYLIERAMVVMEDLDIPPKPLVIGQKAGPGKNVFIYKAINRSPADLLSALQQVNDELKAAPGAETPVEVAIDNAQAVGDTNSVMFIADPDTVIALKDMISSLDTPMVGGKGEFYIYKIQHANEEQIEESLSQMASQLKSTPAPDTDLIDAIDSIRWIKETNSLVFTGSSDAIARLKTILPTFDVSPTHAKTPLTASKNSFLIYNPQFRTGEELEESVNEVGKNLKASGLADHSFITSIESMKWVPSNNSLIFTGDPQSLERIQAVLKTMDVPSPYLSKSTQVFIYKPQYAAYTQIQSALQRMVPTLDPNSISDQNLAKAIDAIEWDPSAQSFIVTSDTATVARLKELMISLDNPQQASGKTAQGFFLYKLQNAQGEMVIDELKKIAEQIPQTNMQTQNVVAAIDKIQWVKSTNSLLITGSSDAIDQVKLMIAEFDMPGLSAKSSFLIFKPQTQSAEELEAAIATTTKDLEEAGLIDPDLFASLSSMKFVPATQSLLFTGSPETLAKVKEMIQRIDTGKGEGAVQHIGKVTFLVYKLQNVSGDQLISSLKNFALQVENSKIEDKDLAKTINDMRYIRETNSLLFIGPPATLERINTLAEKFDIPSLVQAPPAERPAATFVVYNPKSLGGEELIGVLCDFETNLQNSGVNDPGLFDAINNLKWIEKTSSLLISGDQASVTKVQDLLLKFDVPGKETGVPSIETIDNTSFLVYKLQYHQGSDIRDALKQVGHSLSKAANSNQATLMDAINSLQWIQVTNSLLATGQQDILVKLKDLIQNLDIPLRQVFIEVLVIETQLSDAQSFGLMWGSQVQYMNKTILSTGNFPIANGNGGVATTPVGQFSPILQGINATTTPKGGSGGVPFTNGFDLGVIGDIIMHKGKSFISLGSLVNALQQDTSTTIVLNPKLITQDNQQSTIFVGSNIPYTGAVVSTVGTNTQTTGNIEYRDVGVSLTITPILGDNDVVTLDIVHDISEVIANPSGGTIGGTQLTGLTTSHTHMETRVQVPDQHFVALSGMINDSKTRYRTAIPCLGGLPVVGALFSENDRTASKANVIIFLKPYIIHSYDEYKQITEHQEWLYKDNAVLPVLKEEFDAGLDMVKTPENE